LEGDQGGLLGLMALSKMAENSCSVITDENRSKERILRDAQNIGYILVAPLDKAFREKQDLKDQATNFNALYEAFNKRGINLLMAMAVNVKDRVDPSEYNKIEVFERHFAALNPSQQARLAIHMMQLEKSGSNLDPFKPGDALRYAEIAATNAKKLTAGDQVEL